MTENQTHNRTLNRAETSAEAGIAELIAQVEENGCDHPMAVTDAEGRYIARWTGGWCLTCEDWLARLRLLLPVDDGSDEFGGGNLAETPAAVPAATEEPDERLTWTRCTATFFKRCNDGRMRPWRGSDGHGGGETFYTCDRCGRN